MKKERIDVLLVQRGYFESRERAKALIMAGAVFVDGQICDKAGTKVPEDSVIEVRESDCPYVSRGGYKMEKALSEFPIDLTDKVCLDMGASTGGFTDCMLQNGASKVYAVDVGYGQLAWKLRQDPRVINIERCNVRYMEKDTIPELVDFISIDVSFISTRHMFPVAAKVLSSNGQIVSLIKPQFEAGREEMKNTKGIVRDPEVHKESILKVLDYADQSGFYPLGITSSPVKGTKGNIEFLVLLARKNGEESEELITRIRELDVPALVSSAHTELDER